MPTDMIKYLNTVFEQRKAKNKRYSLRAFAQSLGVHSATLSTILAGKRVLSAKQVARLLDRLQIVDEETRLRLIGATVAPKAAVRRELTPIDPRRFAVISGWEHTAIMAACLLDATLDEKTMARKLGLEKNAVAEALARLMGMGMMKKTRKGWTIEDPLQSVSTPAPNESLRECHRQFLLKAQESLKNDPFEIRDFSGVTITANPEKLPLVREAIRDFRLRMAELMDDGKATEVYRLSVQLFPLT